MTGICGWSNAKPDGVDAQQRIGRMCERLPSSAKHDFAILGDSAVGGPIDKNALAGSNDPPVTVVIEGHPRWRDAGFAGIAAEAGPGRALLELYLRDGADFLGNVGGEFALAIVDRRTRRLILAIDRMGVRPMCFADNRNGGLIFGSNTCAVLGYGGISEEISPQALYNYVYFHVIPSPRTVFECIRKLEPGQRLIHADGQIRIDEYWRPQFHSSTAQRAGELREELFESTRTAVARCVNGSETGCFLSGGLDSSTVSGLANECLEEPIRAYSIGFAQAGYDEMEFARIAARHFGLDHREYYVTPDDVADSMHLIATVYDEPFGNASAIPAYFCARRAMDDGVSLLLAGDGGDELFAGNERYAQQRIFEIYGRLPGWIRSHIAEPAVMKFPIDGNVLLHKIRRYVEQARVPMPLRLQTYNYLHMNDPAGIFHGEFLASVDIDQPVLELSEWYGRSADYDLIDRMLWLDWKLTLADNDLRKVNRMCETVGIDVIYPLLDDDLVELSTRIPAKLKMRNNQLRDFYKKTFADFLPAEILTKKKHGFGLPFGEWLADSKKLQDVVLPGIERLRSRRIFRDAFLDDVLRLHRTEHAAFYGAIIWLLTMLDNWLEAQAGPQSPSGFRGLS